MNRRPERQVREEPMPPTEGEDERESAFPFIFWFIVAFMYVCFCPGQNQAC